MAKQLTAKERMIIRDMYIRLKLSVNTIAYRMGIPIKTVIEVLKGK